MSLEETPAIAPKKKAPRRKRKPARAAAPPKPASAFVGLSATTCATECNAEGCVLSGKPYCAHPFKGGLQGRDMGDNAAVARVKTAKEFLGKQKIRVDGI